MVLQVGLVCCAFSHLYCPFYCVRVYIITNEHYIFEALSDGDLDSMDVHAAIELCCL